MGVCGGYWAMSENWIPVFQAHGHLPQKEVWACRDGSDLIEERSHNEGPSNEMFNKSGKKIVTLTPNEAYRQGYEGIAWIK